MNNKLVAIVPASVSILCPATPQDEAGTAFATNQGESNLEISGCT